MTEEQRSAPRKPARMPIEVSDSLTGEAIGRIGNLSRNGMMLICHQPLRDDSLYQLNFRLPGPNGAATDIEAGVHTVWTERAATDGLQWVGMRIISISGPAATALDAWLEDAA